MTRVIGLISGTSADGIDAALVDISGTTADLKIELIAAQTVPYPSSLQEQIWSVIGNAALSMADLATLDDAIATQFARAALQVQTGQTGAADLIGSHGQTVFHRPPRSAPPHLGYSLQLGRGDLIAHQTGITTISNFRAADIALGGQGAPLTPIVDACLLGHPSEHRCVQNIGGIGNVAYLPPQGGETNFLDGVIGWDTGPGNTLLDLAVQHFSKGEKRYDDDGAWAAKGTPCQTLVRRWLKQDFFQKAPPKSTGREEFGVNYLRECLLEAKDYALSRSDVLATLTELTAASIAHSYHTFLPQMPDRVLLCGGGSRNRYLRQRVQVHLDPISVLTTDDVGISSDFKEAIAFAVLAYWRYQNIPGNLPHVTGALQAVPLGEIHPASQPRVIP